MYKFEGRFLNDGYGVYLVGMFVVYRKDLVGDLIYQGGSL